MPWPGRPFSLKRKERSRASPACVCVSACDGEMRGGWREVGVLVSLKSVTHRIGMTSLPKKPGSLLFSSGLLLFRSQTLSLPPPPFSQEKSFLVRGDFSIITARIKLTFVLWQLSSFCATEPKGCYFNLFYFISKYALMQVCNAPQKSTQCM